MMRVKDLPVNPIAESRILVAEFLGLEISEVVEQPQEDTYLINIAGQPEAQQKYRDSVKYGNTLIPGKFDFTGDLLVRWTGKKIQAA